MKIGWFTDHLLYWNGGVRYIYEVTKRLVKITDDDLAVVMSGYPSQDNWDRFLYTDRRLYHFQYAFTAPNEKKYWLLYPFYLIQNQIRIRRTKDMFGSFISSSPTTHILCWLAGIKPILVCFELNPWLYDKEHIKGLPTLQRLIVKLGKPFAVWMERRAYQNASKIIAYSKYVQSEIKRVYKLDSEIIYTGIDTEFFKKTPDPVLEQKYKDRKVLLHVASFLSPRKGTRYAIEAMSNVVKDHPEALLIIIVSRKDNELLNSLIRLMYSLNLENNVEFVFSVPEADIPKYYSIARILLSPSLDENIHLPVIEAQSCECPVIEFDGKGEIEDLPSDGNGIRYFHATNSTEMGVLASLILSKQNPQFGKNARQFVLNNFTWDKCVASYKKVIDELQNL